MVLSDAKKAVSLAHSVVDTNKLIKLAEAVLAVADTEEMREQAMELYLRSRRRRGELLIDAPKAQGKRTDLNIVPKLDQVEKQTLLEQGVDKRDASKDYKLIEIPDERWETFLDKTDKNFSEALSIAKKAERTIKIKEIRENALTINKGPYDVLIIDPPWPYGTKYNPTGRRAASPYPEMSIDEIIEMKDAPLSETAKKNCILWLWTTHKFMRFSFAILDEWGFRDVAILTWVKDRIGLGSWLRSQSEFCIMAVKSKPIVELKNQSTIIYGPLREHSRKPDTFYELVQSLCPGVIGEYFGREKRENIIGVLSNE